MSLPSDNFLIEGYRHRCVCGSFWTDADGRPCHEECSNPDCDAITPPEELDKNGLCPKCAAEMKEDQ